MKIKLLLFLTIFAFGCHFPGKQITVPVIEKKDLQGRQPDLINLASHKDKDFEIFRIGESNMYHTIMYRLENKELKAYESAETLKDNYDKVAYKWVNDSTISFKFVSSSKKPSNGFSMIGNNGWTKLEINK